MATASGPAGPLQVNPVAFLRDVHNKAGSRSQLLELAKDPAQWATGDWRTLYGANTLMSNMCLHASTPQVMVQCSRALQSMCRVRSVRARVFDWYRRACEGVYGGRAASMRQQFNHLTGDQLAEKFTANMCVLLAHALSESSVMRRDQLAPVVARDMLACCPYLLLDRLDSLPFATSYHTGQPHMRARSRSRAVSLALVLAAIPWELMIRLLVVALPVCSGHMMVVNRILEQGLDISPSGIELLRTPGLLVPLVGCLEMLCEAGRSERAWKLLLLMQRSNVLTSSVPESLVSRVIGCAARLLCDGYSRGDYQVQDGGYDSVEVLQRQGTVCTLICGALVGGRNTLEGVTDHDLRRVLVTLSARIVCGIPRAGDGLSAEGRASSGWFSLIGLEAVHHLCVLRPGVARSAGVMASVLDCISRVMQHVLGRACAREGAGELPSTMRRLLMILAELHGLYNNAAAHAVLAQNAYFDPGAAPHMCELLRKHEADSFTRLKELRLLFVFRRAAVIAARMAHTPPPELADPITMDWVLWPAVIPGTTQIVDAHSMAAQLLLNGTNPFNRRPLSIDCFESHQSTPEARSACSSYARVTRSHGVYI